MFVLCINSKISIKCQFTSLLQDINHYYVNSFDKKLPLKALIEGILIYLRNTHYTPYCALAKYTKETRLKGFVTFI